MIVLVQIFMIAFLEWGLRSWIWVALVPLIFGLAAKVSLIKATGRGAFAGGLSWLAASLYFYFTSGRIIAGRMAAMFGLGPGRGWLMVLLTGLLGAFVAGLAALAGASLRSEFVRRIEHKATVSKNP
jgi:uncharacterized membrane protein YeaQ/YmgE (transglycosylase-associated protein family)